VSDARKIYGILVFIAIAGFVASGVSGFLRSSFDFGIDAAESQIFDLQVKLRNLSQEIWRTACAGGTRRSRRKE